MPAHRPFSFAVQANPARNPEGWSALAREAEALGYRALLVPDHVGSGGPFSALAHAGAVTTTLRVGTLMLGVDFRNSAFLADEIATLRTLTGGRDEIGLGAGWLRRDYKLADLPMAPAGVRLRRLRTVAEAFLEQRDAVGSESTQLVLGGGGDRMLGLAADLADIVNLSASMHSGVKEEPLGKHAGLERFVERAELVRSSDRSRPGPPELQCLSFVTEVTADAHGTAARAADGFGLPAEEVLRSPLSLVGTVDEICRKVERCREVVGITYWVVKSPAMHAFAPVVARLAGR